MNMLVLQWYNKILQKLKISNIFKLFSYEKCIQFLVYLRTENLIKNS